MSKVYLLSLMAILAVVSTSNAQQTPTLKKLTPYVEAAYNLGLCGEGNPMAFTAGVERALGRRFSVAADVNYWNTNYANYCCDVYSTGKYVAVIPSVKFTLHLGKKQGRGFFIGAGLGYVIAKDRGTEQSYTTDEAGNIILAKNQVHTNYDFNSLAPSFSWGVTMKIAKMPVSIINTNYFGKTTQGWQPISTSIGLRIGLRRF